MHAIGKRDSICMMIGMTLLWGYLRFQTVIQYLFHKADMVQIFGVEITALTAFLLVVALLGVIVTMAADRVDLLMIRNPNIVLVLGILGSLGILLNLRMHFLAGLPVLRFVFWISTILFAIGFLTNLISWAHYCARLMCGEVLVMLAVSFILSLVLFAIVGMYFPTVKRILVLAIPALIQLCWYLGNRGQSRTQECMPEAEYQSIPNSKLIFILLFTAFLLCGSLIRGVVDIRNHYTTILMFRLYASMALMVAVTVYVFFRMRRFNSSLKAHSLNGMDLGAMTDEELLRHRSADIERSAMACWVFLALAFFCGLLLEFASPAADIGGQLVVVTRSVLDFLLWVLLCNTVRAEHLAPTRMIILFFIMVEVVSWMLSYTLIPNLYNLGFTDRLLETLLVFVMFLMVATLTILFAWFALRKQSMFDQPAVATVATSGAAPAATAETPQVPADIARAYKLTGREMEVITLFSQGYSLAKVAQELYISLGTAQSHIKSVYRKLDVHSKDELITLFDSWKADK